MPFYNIFSKRKSRKNIKQKIRLKIIADIHEKDSLILAELKANREIELIIKPLKIGDYLIGNTIIERKTTRDLISSMINKRLIQQLNQMRKYKQQLLIIEGDLGEFNDFQNPNAIRGFILSIITNYQTPIIFTQDYQDTSKYLITLAKQQLKKPIDISLHSRIPKTIKEQKQYILEAFPNIGPKTAQKLLKKFKTINKTLNASEEELKDILKKRTAIFKNILDS